MAAFRRPERGMMSNAATPKTARGTRTRASILDAGQRVFEAHGYSGAKVADIVSEAGVSTGTFYRYFNSKEEVLDEILLSVSERLYQSARQGWDRNDTRRSLYETTLGFLRGYETNASILVAAYHYFRSAPRAAEAWNQSRAKIWERMERYVSANIEASGDTALDPHIATVALSGMVSSLSLRMFVDQTLPGVTIEDAASTLAEIWYRAIFA